jgi:hypothetical protein
MHGVYRYPVVFSLILCLTAQPLWPYPPPVSEAPPPSSAPGAANTPDPPTTAPICDVTGVGNTSVSDVQLEINEALGVASAANDLNNDGWVNVADVQIVINAVLGLGVKKAFGGRGIPTYLPACSTGCSEVRAMSEQ